MSDLDNKLARILDALEHLACPTIVHDERCRICKARLAAQAPPKKKFASTVLTSRRISAREAQIRDARLMQGPEEPEHEAQRPNSFRYLEREDNG